MRSTYRIEAIRYGAANLPVAVLDRLLVKAEDLEAVKREAVLLLEATRAPHSTWPKAHAVRVFDESGAERFRCVG